MMAVLVDDPVVEWFRRGCVHSIGETGRGFELLISHMMEGYEITRKLSMDIALDELQEGG